MILYSLEIESGIFCSSHHIGPTDKVGYEVLDPLKLRGSQRVALISLFAVRQHLNMLNYSHFIVSIHEWPRSRTNARPLAGCRPTSYNMNSDKRWFSKIDQLNGEQWTFVIKNVLLMERELHLMLKECMRTLTTLLLCRCLWRDPKQAQSPRWQWLLSPSGSSSMPT